MQKMAKFQDACAQQYMRWAVASNKMKFVAVPLDTDPCTPVFFADAPVLKDGRYAIHCFGNPTSDAAVTCTAVVKVEAAEGNTATELPFYVYREVLPSDPAATVARCQYSVARRKVLFRRRINFSGCRASLIEPREPQSAVELAIPSPNAPAQSAMTMWYPIVLSSGFKIPLVRGCLEVGISILGEKMLDAWLKRSGTADLADLASPLADFATYTAERRNQYQNLLLAAACTGERVTGDCEDFALAVFGVMLSLKRHRRSAFGIDWKSTQPCIVAGHIHKPGGTREAHMWAAVQHGRKVDFVETVGKRLPGARYVGVRIIYEDGAAFMKDNLPLPREKPTIPSGPLNYEGGRLPLIEIPFKTGLPLRAPLLPARDWATAPPAALGALPLAYQSV